MRRALVCVALAGVLGLGCGDDDGGGGTPPLAKPTNPTPADGTAQPVPVTIEFDWDDVTGATHYIVYLGTDEAAVETAIWSDPEWLADGPDSHHDPADDGLLDYDTTYYWRVDAHSAVQATTGDVWSFTTESAPTFGPEQVSAGIPAHNALDNPIEQDLSWTAALRATSYEVYFGTDLAEITVADNTTIGYRGSTTDLESPIEFALQPDTTYYWRVDSVNAHGTTAGSVWWFTTAASAGTVYVDGTGGDDANDGTSWATAVETIAKGVELATDGMTVLVADGTYTGAANKNIEIDETLHVKSDGGAAACTIDCEGAGRAFWLHNSYCTIEGFTIINAGTLPGVSIEGGSLVDCVIKDCTARGVFVLMDAVNKSPVRITGCTIEGCSTSEYGGGISAEGYLDCHGIVLDGCTIRDNSAGNYGGGISAIISMLRLRRCTIADNTTASKGGGMSAQLYDRLEMAGCLVAGNDAGELAGGMFLVGAFDSTASITNSTIVNNNATDGIGGIEWGASGTKTTSNSIVWGNTTPGFTTKQIYGDCTMDTSLYADNTLDPYNIAGTITEVGTCLKVDPQFVSKEGENYRLAPRSPAVDAGDDTGVPSALTTDLDGHARIGDGDLDSTADVDLGAYELTPLLVPTGYATIQAAIDAASDYDTVMIEDGTYAGTGNKDLDTLGKAIHVASAGGAGACIINCDNDGRGFLIHSAETVATVIEGLTIRNGYASGAGLGDNNGAGMLIVYDSNPTIRDCVIENCESVSGGGGFDVMSSSPRIEGCTISGNVSGTDGGGIVFGTSGDPVIVDTVISGNTATEAGGGIACYASVTLTMEDCVVDGNTALTDGGGAVFGDATDPTVTNCLFTNNLAGGSGGGLATFESTTAAFQNCTIADNDASDPGDYNEEGGGVCAYDSAAPIFTDCIFWGNTSTNAGYQIVAASGTDVQLVYCDYSNAANDVDGPGMTPTACVTSDPLFVTDTTGDYYLSQTESGQGADSPCWNAGSAAASTLSMDEKTTRTDGATDYGTVDIGYHYDE